MNEVILVGSTDRLLPDLLQEAGHRVIVVDLAGLASLAHASAPQPDAVVVDLRRNFVMPAAVAALENQPSVDRRVDRGGHAGPRAAARIDSRRRV